MDNNLNLIVLWYGGDCTATVYEIVKSKYQHVIVFNDSRGTNAHIPSESTLQSVSDVIQKITSLGLTNVDVFLCSNTAAVRRSFATQVSSVFSAGGITVQYPVVVHPSAFISETSSVGEGSFVGPFALVDSYSAIGKYCWINSRATVDPDTTVGEFGDVSSSPSADSPSDHLAARLVAPKSAKKQLSKYRVPWVQPKEFSQETFMKYLQPCLDAGHLTNNPPNIHVLAEKFRLYTGTSREVHIACNGTAALHALGAAHILHTGKALRWATTSYNFSCSVQGPFRDITLLDLDEIHLGPNLRDLEERKNDFDGILIINVFGYQCPSMLMYEAWCIKNQKLMIIDNAASPLGFAEDGRSIHDIGDGSIVSLHETKAIGRGEGGVIICKSHLSLHIQRALNFGYDIGVLPTPHKECSNWKMSAFAVAVICDHVDRVIETDVAGRHKAYFDKYFKHYTDLGFVTPFKVSFPSLLSCLHLRLPNSYGSSPKFIAALNAMSVEAKHYYRPLNTESESPFSWKLYMSTACIPISVDDEKNDYVLECVRKIIDDHTALLQSGGQPHH